MPISSTTSGIGSGRKRAFVKTVGSAGKFGWQVRDKNQAILAQSGKKNFATPDAAIKALHELQCLFLVEEEA